MAESHATTTFQVQGIQVNIPEVTETTKLSDLTVLQYVDLLAQVLSQLRISRRIPDPEELKAAFEQVRKMIAGQNGAQNDASAINDVVRQTQQLILERIPQMVQSTARRAQDAGPSPYAKPAG